MADVKSQLETFVQKYDEIRQETGHDDLSGGSDDTRHKTERLLTRVVAATERLLPPGSAYAEHAEEAVARFRHPRSGVITNPEGLILSLFEVLRAFAEDIDAGFLEELEAAIRAGVFADFLEMADHVLSDIHRTPAAVIAGFTLEEHLRKMCEARDISTELPAGGPKKADALNAELAKADAYLTTEAKEVTTWLGRRNDAAHGHHDRYSDAEVSLMIEGVRGFLSRHPT